MRSLLIAAGGRCAADDTHPPASQRHYLSMQTATLAPATTWDDGRVRQLVFDRR